MNTLTFLIPIYNIKQEYIERCIYSVLDALKENENCEAIVIDNGSTNPEIFQWLLKIQLNKQIRIYRINKNKGKAPAIAFGINQVKTSHFQVVDSDDWIDFKKVNKIIDVINKTKSDFYVLPYYYYNNKKNVSKKRQLIKTKQEFINIEKFPIFLWHLEVNVIRSKDLLLKTNFSMPSSLDFYEDVFLNSWSLDKASSIVFINIPYYFYRIKQQGSNLSSLTQLSKRYKSFLEVVLSQIKYLNFQNIKTEKHLVYYFNLQVVAYIFLMQFSEKKFFVPKQYKLIIKRMKKENPILFKKYNIFNFHYLKLGKLAILRGYNPLIIPIGYIVNFFRK